VKSGTRHSPVRSFLLIPLLSFPGFGADVHEGATLSGPEVLVRAVKTYANVTTYRDAVVVRIVYIEGGGRRTEERLFKTAFVRPDRFRFEYTESNPLGRVRRYVVWQHGPDVRKWWDVEPTVETLPSLETGLAGATGVSGGSAHTVPRLLLPSSVTGRSLGDMTEVKRLSDAECGGDTCARVVGIYAGSQRTLWISLRSFLLRRVEWKTTFPDFRTESTITYEPVADEPIPAESLAFDPSPTE
jgi:outer membrane lipoprotein-sorting protein